jgi:hypothetical protein
MLDMDGTQIIALLLHIRCEDQIVHLLPYRFYAATGELSTEAIILGDYTDVVPTKFLAKLNEVLVVSHFAADSSNDVEDGVGIRTFESSFIEVFESSSTQSWFEILVGRLVEVEPDPPLLFASESSYHRQLVDATEDVSECSRIILFQLDGLLFALLTYTSLAWFQSVF